MNWIRYIARRLRLGTIPEQPKIEPEGDPVDQQTCRVVGIQPDGKRSIIGRWLTRKSAESIVAILASSKSFGELVIEENADKWDHTEWGDSDSPV